MPKINKFQKLFKTKNQYIFSLANVKHFNKIYESQKLVKFIFEN